MTELLSAIYRYYLKACDVWFDEGPRVVLTKTLQVLFKRNRAEATARPLPPSPPPMISLKSGFRRLGEHYGPSRLKIQRFIRNLGYDTVCAIKSGAVFKIQKDEKYYLFKRVGALEFPNCKAVVTQLASLEFRRMIVPKFIDGGKDCNIGYWMIFLWEDGESIDEHWRKLNENSAGNLENDSYPIDILLDIIEDLQSVDVSLFDDVPFHRVTSANLGLSFKESIQVLRDQGLLTPQQESRAVEIIEPFIMSVEDGAWQLSNGDLNFSNIIEQLGTKTVLIDWSLARLSTFELEHCIAYFWLIVFVDPLWQRKFLGKARERFQVDGKKLHALFLINALLLGSATWIRQPEFQRTAINNFINFLEDDYFASIWKP